MNIHTSPAVPRTLRFDHCLLGSALPQLAGGALRIINPAGPVVILALP